MMMPDHWEDSAKRLERRADFLCNNRMILHDSSFFRVQRTGFKKNGFWHVNFSYVVEPTGDAEPCDDYRVVPVVAHFPLLRAIRQRSARNVLVLRRIFLPSLPVT